MRYIDRRELLTLIGIELGGLVLGCNQAEPTRLPATPIPPSPRKVYAETVTLNSGAITSYRFGAIENRTKMFFQVRRSLLNEHASDPRLDIGVSSNLGVGVIFIEGGRQSLTQDEVLKMARVHRFEEDFPIKNWVATQVSLEPLMATITTNYPRSHWSRGLSRELTIQWAQATISAVNANYPGLKARSTLDAVEQSILTNRVNMAFDVIQAPRLNPIP